MGPKQCFLNLLKNSIINFYWIIMKIIYPLLFYNENLHDLLCSCTTATSRKIFVSEIWAKMFSASQIAGFFNQPYLQNKSSKQPDFLLVDTNSHKVKVYQKILGGHDQKWVWPVWTQEIKIDCISRMNRWYELIVCMLLLIHKS